MSAEWPLNNWKIVAIANKYDHTLLHLILCKREADIKNAIKEYNELPGNLNEMDEELFIPPEPKKGEEFNEKEFMKNITAGANITGKPEFFEWLEKKLDFFILLPDEIVELE